MERQIPKNVRQIGNVSGSPKVYIEDYVDTFFTQLCEKAGEEPLGAFLVGETQKIEEEEYIYIYGAIQMHELKMEGKNYVIDEETWKDAYEDCKLYFEEGEMIGWFVTHSGTPLQLEGNIVKLHKKSFPKKNTLFIMKDSVEKEEAFYIQKFNDLIEMGGHYTYYEKNPSMQNYMIASRKKNGVSPSETVEDRATKDFRSVIKNREEKQRKKSNRMLHAASACLVIVVLAMFAVTMSNLDKMKSVQTALNKITEENLADEDSFEEEDTSQTQDDLKKEEEKKQDSQIMSEQKEHEEGITQEQNEQDSQEKNQEQIEKKEEQEEQEEQQSTSSDNVQGRTMEQNVSNGDNGVYIVEKGDTLVVISKKIYGDMDHVDVICKMNGLQDGNLIYVGQKLVLP